MIRGFFISTALSLSLVACASASVNTGKSLALAWQGLDAASVAADAAIQAGKLKGSDAATVAADIRKAQTALNTATVAYGAATSTTDQATQVAIATAATAEIVAILANVGAK